MKIIFFLIVSILATQVYSQDSSNYIIYAKERTISFEKMAKQLAKKEVVLFGELHDDSIAHVLELELSSYFYNQFPNSFALGAEMFETHQSSYLQKYLASGNLNALTDSTKLWSNFASDYFPTLQFAQVNQIPYYATNIPRKYASLVFKKGINALDSLTVKERALICPLPFPFDSTLSQYKECIQMGIDMHASGMNFALAQAIKDATMAWNITNALRTNEKLLHFNGSFHSNYYQGIYWYIKQYRPKTKIATIAIIKKSEFNHKRDCYIADFVIVVDDKK
jgi:uncharacterized iron-regulated protein